MKQYRVFIDITVTKTFSLKAESEEQAKEEALRMCRERSDYYARDNDGVIDVSVSDCEEDTEPEKTGGMAAGLAYLREQLEQDEIDEIRAQIDRSYRYHMMPSDCVTNDSKVIDLLEEYGADNDLPEGWWENEGDIDDWLLKL